MMVIPKAPFPSFTLALSRQNSQTTEDVQPQERGAELDLMKTFDPRMPHSWNMPDASDEDKSDTETIFEIREERQKSGKETRAGKKLICLPKLSMIFRLLTCSSGSTSSKHG